MSQGCALCTESKHRSGCVCVCVIYRTHNRRLLLTSTSYFCVKTTCQLLRPPPLHTNMNRTTPLFGTVCLALLPSLLCSKYTGTRARVFANLALSHPPPPPSSFLCLRSFSFPPSLSFRYFYSLCSFYFKCSKTTRMNLTIPTKGSQLTLRKEL